MACSGEGAGAFPAGEGDAGWDPLCDPHARALGIVAAPKFDPFNRVYVTNPDGTLQDEHPVIHRARHLMGIRRRALASSPTQGIPLEGIRTSSDDNRQRECEDAAAVALAPLTEAGDLRIVRVAISAPWDGTFYTEIVNLRAADRTPVKLTASLE